MIIHAAEKYGVTAVGITLSDPQVVLANERIRRAGLSDRCIAKKCDYRDVDEPEQYDKIVSVGMFEHVGEAMLPEYFKRAWKLLKPGECFSITALQQDKMHSGGGSRSLPVQIPRGYTRGPA